MTCPAPRSHVALDHDLGAADRYPGYGAGIAADDDGSSVHVVGQPPASVSFDVKTGGVCQSGTEVSGRATDMDVNRMDDADTDVMACIGIENLDDIAPGRRLANALVGFAGRQVLQIDRDHVL